MRHDLNIIIVNYNSADLTTRCVSSIAEIELVPEQAVFVVDNASPDGSGESLMKRLPHNKIILADRNAGFSAGINTAAAIADRKYLLILNPDTYFRDATVEIALDLLEASSQVGLTGLDLLYPNGNRQFSARRFYSLIDILARRSRVGRVWPLNRLVKQHMMESLWEAEEPFEADWVMGTGFIIRRDLFERIGGMNESYFLYMEDVDICARVWGAGYTVMCVPGARLVHDHQRLSAASPLSRQGLAHLESLTIFQSRFPVPLFAPPQRHRMTRGTPSASRFITGVAYKVVAAMASALRRPSQE